MNKVFPHSPYTMYSEYAPVYGYYVDDDPKSPTFGEQLFGQIGEKNIQKEYDSFKADTDMTYIKEELLRQNGDSFAADFVEDELDKDEDISVYDESDNKDISEVTPNDISVDDKADKDTAREES